MAGAFIVFVFAVDNSSEEPKAADEPKKQEQKKPEQVKLDLKRTITVQKDEATIKGKTEQGAKVIIYEGEIKEKKLAEPKVDDKGNFSFLAKNLEREVDNAFYIVVKKEKKESVEKYFFVHRELSKKEKVAKLKKEAEDIPYKQLKKAPDKYRGKIAKYKGQILEIHEKDGITVMRIAVTQMSSGIWNFNDALMVRYEGTIKQAEDDIVTVYGELTGNVDYTSQAGWDISIPGMEAGHVE
ncbi:hypothetical protein [Melghirimyces profundicolus]|nr:hypothetical protein [Melghirimyces profundicolus]